VHALLEPPLLQIFCSNWKEITEILEDLLMDAHEACLGEMLGSLENDIRLEVAEDLILSEDRIFGQKHEVFDLKLVVHGD